MTRTEQQDVLIGQWGVAAACVVYALGLAGVSLGERTGSLKYLTYYSAFVFVAPLLLQSKTRINLPATLFLVVYISVAFASITAGQGWRGGSSKLDFVVIGLTIMCYLPVLLVRPEHINGIFYFTLALFGYSLATSDYTGVRFLEMLSMGTGAAVTSGYNSNEGLLGPAYAIFFHAVGATGQFGLAVLMVLLGGKRIGLLAMIAGICVLALFRRLAPRGRLYLFAALFGILASINLAAVSASIVSELVSDALGSGVHIEEVMLGRYTNTKIMTEAAFNRDWAPWFFGTGVGTANDLIEIQSNLLPHNDWLKILVDYGVVGSILITVCMAFLFSCSTIGCALGVGTAVMMVTDNNLIYLYYQIPVALMVAYSVLHPVPNWPRLWPAKRPVAPAAGRPD